jgi:hypothetical protein
MCSSRRTETRPPSLTHTWPLLNRPPDPQGGRSHGRCCWSGSPLALRSMRSDGPPAGSGAAFGAVRHRLGETLTEEEQQIMRTSLVALCLLLSAATCYAESSWQLWKHEAITPPDAKSPNAGWGSVKQIQWRSRSDRTERSARSCWRLPLHPMRMRTMSASPTPWTRAGRRGSDQAERPTPRPV